MKLKEDNRLSVYIYNKVISVLIEVDNLNVHAISL